MVLLIPLIAAGLGLFGVRKYKQVLNDTWSIAADELGIGLLRGGLLSNPELDGRIGDATVHVSVRSGGQNDSNHTRYDIRHRPVGPPVKLTRQTVLSPIARFFGKRDVEIGDPFFDDKVVIDSAAPGALPEFLTPTRRAVVLEVFDRWRNATVTHESIIAETSGIESVARNLTANVRRLVDIAAVMTDSGAVDAALTKQLEGSMGEAAADLHTINEGGSNTFTEILEAEALVELGEHERAAAVFDVVEKQLDAPASEGWQALADQPSRVSLPAKPLAAAVDLSQQAVIDDLFDTGRLSYEIVEQFEKRYVNVTVSWTGTVKNLHSYRHDTDFGAGPGLKATVLLGGTGRSNLISNEVHAIVELPEEAAVERGREMTFTGTLVRVDRFARKLYVQRASPG